MGKFESVVTLNVQSLRSLHRKYLLEIFLRNLNGSVVIVLLSEINLRIGEMLNINNFKCFLNTREGDGGGVAILLRCDVEFRNIKRISSPFESISLEAFLNNEWVEIGSVYIPPNIKKSGQPYQINRADIEKLFTMSANKKIYGGDFNARSTQWDNVSDNHNGKIISEFINDSEFQIHAPNTPTCFRSPDGSIIDFFISSGINEILECKSFPSFSDHNAVIIKLKLNSNGSNAPLRIIKQYNLTNFKKLNGFIFEKLELLEIPVNRNLSIANIENIAGQIDQIFSNAVQLFVPTIQIPMGNIILSQQTKSLNKKFKDISRKKYRNRLTMTNEIRVQFNLIKNMLTNSIKNDINI